MTAAETMGMELAYQIQKRLYESSLTAEVFAQQCGVPEELVAQAMEEESIPIEAVQKICDTLGISVDSLRRMPVSGNFVELQRLVLDIIQAGRLCSYQTAAEDILSEMEDVPLFEQSRNFRWLKQTIEHPEMYARPKAQQERRWHKQRLRKLFQKRSLVSSVCLTRKISKRQKDKLEQLIEDSKKK